MIMAKIDNGIDRLSALPDSILYHILSFLETTDAVRTSVLSTRWRSLYTSVSALDFCSFDPCPYKFMKFVDRVLLSHDAPRIEKFRLIFQASRKKVDPIQISSWIAFALKRNLRELLIIGHPILRLPPSFFSSKTLVNLELELPGLIMALPIKVCFPSLKFLHLGFIEFVDYDSVPRLLSGCPVLEDLRLRCFSCHGQNVTELNICHPSLKRLTLYLRDDRFDVAIDATSVVFFEYSDNRFNRYSLVNLPSLVDARMVDLTLGKQWIDRDAASNLLKGICNVRSLYCNYDVLWLLTFCNKPMPVFHNLVHVEIREYSPRQRTGLVELLECSINLQTLIFHEGALEDNFWHPPKTVPSCLLSHLKVIEIYSFCGSMEMVKYLLKNARVLEKLKIQTFLRLKNKLEVAQKLLMLPRESKMCQVEMV